jgi:hypothetical protein
LPKTLYSRRFTAQGKREKSLQLSDFWNFGAREAGVEKTGDRLISAHPVSLKVSEVPMLGRRLLGGPSTSLDRFLSFAPRVAAATISRTLALAKPVLVYDWQIFGEDPLAIGALRHTQGLRTSVLVSSSGSEDYGRASGPLARLFARQGHTMTKAAPAADAEQFHRTFVRLIHSFWSGPHGSERALRIRWLMPIAANVSAGDELPAVIHTVRGESMNTHQTVATT